MNNARETARLRFYRAAVLAAYGAALLVLLPTPLSLVIYAECRVRAIYQAALGFEAMADAMSFNPS